MPTAPPAAAARSGGAPDDPVGAVRARGVGPSGAVGADDVPGAARAAGVRAGRGAFGDGRDEHGVPGADSRRKAVEPAPRTGRTAPPRSRERRVHHTGRTAEQVREHDAARRHPWRTVRRAVPRTP